MPHQVLKRLASVFPGKLEGKEVLVVGVGFKPGSSETIETPAQPLVRLLRQAGACPVYVDSAVSVFKVDDNDVEKVEFSAIRPGRFKIAIVVAGDPQVEFKKLSKVVDFILDASGGRAPGVDAVDCFRI